MNPETKAFTKSDTLTAKGVAISLMFFYHLFHEAADVENLGVIFAPFSKEVFLMLSGFGNICVAMFVFLSAYGISAKIREAGSGYSETGTAVKSTAKRLISLMLRFVFVYLLINACLWMFFDYGNLYGTGFQGAVCTVTDMLGLAELFGTPTLNLTWWYMPLAYLIILMVPVLYRGAQKIKWLLLPLAMLLPLFLEMNTYYYMYICAAIWGVCAFSGDWNGRIREWKIPVWGKAAAFLLLMALCIPVRQNYLIRENFSYITEGAVALVFCFGSAFLFSKIPVIGLILRFWGKHSMTMYLVHTFVYLTLFRGFTYSFRYGALIWLVLMAVCTAFAVASDVLYDCLMKRFK